MDLFQGLANRAESLLEKIDGQAARSAESYRMYDNDENDEHYDNNGDDYSSSEEEEEEEEEEDNRKYHNEDDHEGDYVNADKSGRTSSASSSSLWKLEAQKVADRLQSATRYVSRSVTPVSYGSIVDTEDTTRNAVRKSSTSESTSEGGTSSVSEGGEDFLEEEDTDGEQTAESYQGGKRPFVESSSGGDLGTLGPEGDDKEVSTKHLRSQERDARPKSAGPSELVKEDGLTVDLASASSSKLSSKKPPKSTSSKKSSKGKDSRGSKTMEADSTSIGESAKSTQNKSNSRKKTLSSSSSAKASSSSVPVYRSSSRSSTKHDRSGSMSSSTTQNLQASQTRRIEALESELQTLERQLTSVQEDLDAAHEALEVSRKGMRTQEAKLRKELDEVASKHAKREKEMQRTIRDKENKITTLQKELEELRDAADLFDADYDELQNKYDAVEQELQQSQAQLKQASEASHSGAEDLEQELLNAQNNAEQARREFTVQINEAERRIAELENLNTELSNELAATQRRLEERDEHDWNAQERSALENDHQSALYETQEAQRHAEEMLAQERRRILGLQQELEAIQAELERVMARKDLDEQRWQGENRQLRELVERIKQEMDAMRKRDDIQGVAALEERLAALSEHLVAKQKQVEALTSEKGALRQRLKSLERQHEELRIQMQASSARRNNHADVEMGNGANSVSLRFRRRQETAALRIARLELIARHPSLAEAVDVVDQLALSSGVIMQREPWVRLSFLAYMLLLHLWVIFILVFHTHGTIPMEVSHTSGR